MTSARVLALMLAMFATQASAQTTDHAPVALRSADELTQDRGESWTYAKPGLDLKSYRSVLIEPTTVYTGPDAQFGGVAIADRQRFASMLTERLRADLPKAIPVVSRPGAGTLRLRMTLLGMTETVGGAATATRVTPMGFGLSAAKSLAGRQGTLTGSMLLAVEVFDARTGELQVAAVRRRSPDALDVPATVSNTETVKAIARDVADNIARAFQTGKVRRGR
jgi:Protein of unknown function (DUF3313)